MTTKLHNTNWTPMTRTEGEARRESIRLNRSRKADDRRAAAAEKAAAELAECIKVGQALTLSAGDVVDGWLVRVVTRAGDAGMDALSAEFSRRGLVAQVGLTRPRGHRPHVAHIGRNGRMTTPRAL